MADKRKLQGEIERCIKKVVEGVEVFEDLWQKIYSTTNVNIKEKHEADLKKEIKKLQRLRDSIKNWLTSPDVKDKETLSEYKRLIEQQMERFKVVEKETKTKAYSKEGLGAMAKVDPKEKEKEVMLAWLSNSINDLKLQTDQIESEIEGLTVKKKKIDRDKQDQIENCKYSLERQKFHIGRLELVMRLVDNDALQIEQVHKIKEDIDYYVSSNRESGFEENEFIYDDLHLDEISATLGSKVIDAPTTADDDLSTTLNLSDATSLPSSSCPSPTPSNLSHNTVHKDEISRERKKSHSEDFPTPNSKSSTSANSRPQHSTSSNNIASRSLPFSVRSNNELQQPSSQPLNCVTVCGQNYAQVASLGVFNHQELSTRSSKVDSAVDLNSRQDGKINQKLPLVTSPRIKQQKLLQHSTTSSLDNEKKISAKVLGASSETSENVHVMCSTSEDVAAANHVYGQLANDQTLPENFLGSLNSIDEFIDDRSFTKRVTKKHSIEPEEGKHATMSSVSTISLSVSNSCAPLWSSVSNLQTSGTISVTSQSCNGPQPNPAPVITAYSLIARPAPTQVSSRPPYNLSVSQPLTSYHGGSSRVVRVDLPCMFGRRPLSSAESQGLDRISAALDHFPLPVDSRMMLSVRVEDYLKLRLDDQQHLKPFTQHVPCSFYHETIYHNFQSDTLFFIFYYMEGTLAQFLAAKALKNLSWRFHTKYFTWFQRMMDPSIITEEYEQGSYVYFDFVEWVQKNLESFTFEYKYLEDKEL